MGVRKVHGCVNSVATLRVISCLHEKNLDFEFVPVDIKSGAHKKEPFISLNPFGKVPAFEDGDLKLFGSRAITRHIARKHASSGIQLIYPDSKKMATIDEWMEFEAHEFDPVASVLAFELAVKPIMGMANDAAALEGHELAFELAVKLMKGMATDAAALEEHKTVLGKVLDVYEVRLTESKYLGGDSFTLADLHHLPNIYYLMATPAKKLFESHPRVSAWCTDIMVRPAWLKTILTIAILTMAMQKQV